jgi:hypothetical protein
MTFIKLDSAGAQLADDATDHAMVQDAATGLQYAVRAPGCNDVVPQDQAVSLVAALNYAGGQNWRLPTPQELFAVVKFIEGGIVADLDLFPDTQANWYWTDQTAPSSVDCYFAVYFCQGHVGFLKRTTLAYVRPVRLAAAS